MTIVNEVVDVYLEISAELYFHSRDPIISLRAKESPTVVGT